MQSFILPLVLVVVMIWWMSRSQKKQQARQAEMKNQMVKGSDVVTIGGLHAKVDRVNEAEKTVDLDCEGVILTFELTAIRSVKNAEAAKTEETAQPAEEAQSADDKKED
ncbi:preprotein translocase subunit YajC [Fructobacillus parabroussonetiae]|uniref:Preprotein translocase subunit YajC n=1 Tax=Fructobacillus parabroussonetiae TaxID=2713174 RepID=A0ABS5QXJ9_9LACO|nr:preprotein translocase subunit YajC [Fructobacillus parabroussonetiae]MBS9337841.1 preprotein translocase subunit YajC [Fructobacillus parabroussonetiae]MCK8617630.1 preprotein translocase subunit YajC [Fructobacillus parabroussonetiae]